MTTTGAEVTLREMRWWDIAPVLVLEHRLFPEDAWSPGMFWSELARARGPGAGRRYVLAETPQGGVAGYGGFAAVEGTGDIQTIAVAPEHQGTGLGARLLSELLTAATAFECAEVLLEVRVDNPRAQRLYERFGFEPIGFRRGYYQPGNVDALVMRRPHTAAPVEPPPVEPLPSGPAPGGPPAAAGPATAPSPGGEPPAGKAETDHHPEQGTTTHG